MTEAYEIKPICGTKEELPFIDQEEYDEMNNRDPSMIEQVRPQLFVEKCLYIHSFH